MLLADAGTGKRWDWKAAILPDRAPFAMSGLTRHDGPGQGFGSGYHPSAVIDRQPQLGNDVP